MRELLLAAQRGESTTIIHELKSLAAKHPATWVGMLKGSADEESLKFVMKHVFLSGSRSDGFSVTFRMPRS